MNDEIRQFVRERANYSCEYCGVSETDSGGELTIDHFKPQSKNGSDEKENLVYACVRCNLYKSDYYPETETDKELWNPRFETSENHFVELPNGKLFALTDTGVFTIKLLRLNRNPLVNYRVKKQKEIENRILLESYRNVLEILRKTLEKQRFLIAEQNELLEEQHKILKAIFDDENK